MQKEYTQTKEQVLEGLRTDRQGLSAQEAEKRLREHGENRLKEAERSSNKVKRGAKARKPEKRRPRASGKSAGPFGFSQ